MRGGAGGGAPTAVWGARQLMERAGASRLEFLVSPQSFRQTNPRQAEAMVGLVASAAGAPGCCSFAAGLVCVSSSWSACRPTCTRLMALSFYETSTVDTVGRYTVLLCYG